MASGNTKNWAQKVKSVAQTAAAPQTARQRMMLDEEDEDKWYRGTMPTSSETLARIYTIGKSDPQQGQKLFDAFTSFQNDPSTPYYNPYSRATNRAIDEIAALGVDTSGGIGSDWLQRNASLMNSYRLGTGASPLAPSSKSTQEQNAAYWYYKIADAEETTQKAETEWAALQEEIAYWVGRSDRNYSDDEILSRIDWSQYKTLTAMDETRQKGTPMTLNRAIGYSQDALYGAIWAARNGGGTGNPMIDGVKAALGEGNQWQENTDISGRLDPTSDRYNPYSVGATLDDAALYFGVPSFDQTWLDGNRAYLSGSDKTAKKYYSKVYDAEQTTQKAEAELTSLWSDVDSWLTYTSDPDVILDGLLDNYPTLKKMDESRKSGDLLATTRAIDYRWEDVEAEVRKRCAAQAEAKKADAYVADVTGALGAQPTQTQTDGAISEAKDSIIGAAGKTIGEIGTKEEQSVWKSAYSADFDTYIVQISEALQNGVTDPQGGYDYCLERANEYAGAQYIQARESGDEQTLASIRRSYEIADRMAALTGATPGDTQSAMSALDYAYQYGRDYVPTNWTAQSLYDAALEQGSSLSEVRAAAKQGAQEMQAEIARIDEAIAYIDSHNIVLDRTILANMQRERDRLERDMLDAGYFELSGNEDFEQVSQETADQVRKAWSGFSLLPTSMGRDGYSELDYAMTDTAAAIRSDTLVPYMTDTERNTYLYLLGTQGRDAAKAYYDHLANEENGVLQTRQTQRGTAFWQEFTQEHPLAGNALAVIASPMQAAGGLYSVKAKLSGQEINPNASAFAATHMNAAIRGTSKEMITQEFGEGTAANFLANLGYDAVTSSADSLVSLYLGGGSSMVSSAIMASQAASSAIEDAKQRGATDEQALMLGGVNFLAETMTEKLPMDQLLKIGKMPPETVREFLTTTLKQMAAEGTEELVSGVIETASDELIMKNLSAMNTSIAMHMADGMSEEDARKAAFREAVTDILYGGLAGSVSGGLSATAQTAMNLPGRRRQQNMQETSPEGQNGPSEPSQTGTEEVPAEAPTGGEEARQSGTEGTGAKPGTEEAPAGNEETQQPGTESAEAPPSLTEEEAALLTRQQAVLAQALTTEDTASRTATLAGVLAAEGGDFEATSAASAAAQHMMTQYGSQTAIEMTREILLTAAELRMSGETLRAALHTAALGEGTSTAVLDQIMTEGPSFELLGALVDAASEDVGNPAVQETMRRAVTDNQIATRVKALIADGALSGLRSYEEGVSKASSELRTAQKGFSTAVDDYRVAGENLENLQAQWAQNPSDAALQGAMQQAVKDVGGKAIVVEQYRQSVEKAQEQVKKAQDALASVREETMKRIREQAQQEVMQAKEQAKTERAQKEEQASIQRDIDNANALDAETYIDEKYPDAPEEKKQQIRNLFAETANRKQASEDFAARDRLARSISRRFSVDIQFLDRNDPKLNGNSAGYSRKGNTIYMATDATRGDVVRSLFVHELTHRAEQSKVYNALKNSLLAWKYGDNADQQNADRDAIYGLYKNAYEASGRSAEFETDGNNIAESEQVARIAEELLGADDDTLIRLVSEKPSLARQMVEALKGVIDRFRGVNDPEVENLRRVESLMRKALDDVERKRRSEYRAAAKTSAHPGGVQFSVSQLAEATGLDVRMNDDGIPYSLIDKDGNEVTSVTPDMLKSTPVGNLIRAAQTVGTINQATADAQMKLFADLTTLAAQYKDQAMVWEIAGSQMFSAIKDNSDKQYGTTVDFGTICAKTQAIVDVMSETMVKLGRGLTREEVIDAYRETAGVGYNVPCPVCYVFSRWMGVPSLLGNMAEYQRRFDGMSESDVRTYVADVESRYSDGSGKPSSAIAKAKTKIEGKLARIEKKMLQLTAQGKSVESLVKQAKPLEDELSYIEAYNWVTQVLCKKNVRDANGQVVLDPDYTPVPDEILLDLRRTGDFANDKYKKSWTYRTTRGAGMGKAILPHSGARIGDTVKGTKDRWADIQNAFLTGDDAQAQRSVENAIRRMKAQNLIGGQRFQSTSDYRPEWGIDYMMTFLEMQAIGAKGQLYTKVIEAVDMFATAGIEVNLSIMPKGNGWHVDENGNKVLDFSSVTGIDFDQAYEKTKQYDNVQMILVGINDEHINLAMADNRIGFIIPWHASGNSGETLTAMMDAVGEKVSRTTDYTKSQSDKENSKATQAQKDAMELRMRILTGDTMKNGLTDSDQRILDSNPYLADLYHRFCVDETAEETYGVALSAKQASQVFPFEYWDTSLTVDQADENGRRFREYCESIGLKPRFPQFADKPGYWKLLIDRSMYNLDGTYHQPKQIDVTGVEIGSVAQSVGEVKYGDSAKTSEAVQAVLDDIRARLPAEQYADGEESDMQYSLRPVSPVEQKTADENGDPAWVLGHSDIQYALPDNDLISRDINNWMDAQNTDNYNGDGDNTERPMRERQFATQTAQRSQAIPQWLKNELLSDPNERYYEADTNNDQIVRSWERLQTEGYEAMRDRLLAADATLDNADDVADANMLMAMANREGDMQTLLDLARHYNKEGTRQAKAFQARKIFSRMTPAGVRALAAGDCENRLGSWMDGHQPAKRSADRKAEKTSEQIRQLQGGDELLRLEAASEYTITRMDARYGVPINEQQRELIRQFGLENVNRPVFYNKATRQQRMLEAILMEPNPLNATGFGLNLVERLYYCQAGAPVIFNSDLDYIGYNMAQFASAPLDEQEDRFGDLALSRVYEAYGNITEPSLREKLRTWKYTSMLLSLPSAGRNVIGNAAQNTVNAASHSLAAALDAAVGQMTGRRTRANITIRELAGGWNAFVRETVNTYRDYFVDRAVTQRGDDRFNLNQRGRVYQNNALETLRTLESFLMSVGDRNFWRMAYANSMAEQQRVARLNGEELDFETANERAQQDANFATFTEDSAVRDGLATLKRVPIIGDVLDILMPFTGVPTNIIGRMWQYSPAGLAEAVIRHGYRGITGQTFDQGAFVDSMARGLTGTAMFGVGMLLRSLAAIKLGTGDEDDKKVYGVRSAQGDQYSPYIQLGEENISLAAFSPAASALTMGAVAYDTLKDSDDAIDALMNACFGGLDQIFDASYMTAMQDLFNGVRTTGSFSESAANSVFSNAVSQNVPSLLGQLATALDPYVRDTKDRDAIMQAIKTGIVNKVPGLRQMLPEKVDVAGRSVTSKEGLANFFDPLNRTKVASDPALTELMRLNETLGTSDFMPSDALSGTKTALTGVAEPVEGKDKEAYRKRYGELWRLGGSTYDANGQRVTIQGVDSLIRTSAYQSMSDEEKANAIGGIVSAAKTGAAYEMGEKLGHIEKAEKSSGYAKKPVRAMPEQFANSDSPMIKRLADKYEETGDGAFIPKGISSRFSVNKVSYSLEGEEYDLLWSLYEKELNGKLMAIDWVRLSDEELAAAVESAYSSAATAAKKQYAKKHK